MSKVIVVAPHADDEIIGCGATIAKHIDAGDQVFVIIATNASTGAPEIYSPESINAVRKEAREAHDFLGVSKTFFLDFPAPALNSFPEYKISLELDSLFKKINPNYLYLPHPGDMHQDHKAIYRASLVAARPTHKNKIAKIYCYETLSETEWGPMNEKPFVPNHFENSENHFYKKIEAMKFFKSQIREFPNPRSIEAMEALAQFRGATCGFHRAEAFTVERQISL